MDIFCKASSIKVPVLGMRRPRLVKESIDSPCRKWFLKAYGPYLERLEVANNDGDDRPDAQLNRRTSMC